MSSILNLAGTEDQVKKKKVRESKNRKKYWKKIDNAEVEEYLESKRFDERVGGDVSLREDSMLFTLDNSAADVDEQEPTRKKKKKSDILNEPLRSTQVLRERSKVAVPYEIVNGKTDDERKSEVQLKREQKLFQKRMQQSKNLAAKRQQDKKAKQDAPKCQTLNSQTILADLWDEKKQEPKKTESGCHLDVLEKPEDAEVLTKDQLAYFARITKKSRPRVPGLRYKKPSRLPAVEVAKPGASYKPTIEDHQDLLAEAHEVEVKKLKQEEHLERVLTSLFPDKEQAKAARLKNKLEEAAGILYSDESDPEEDMDTISIKPNAPVLAENRKTQLQRNRQKTHQQRIKATALKKLEKKFDSQFGRIGVYKKELKKTSKITQERIREREQKMIDAMYQPKKLGRQKFRAPDIEIKLSDEIPANLRQLKPEGSLLLDRQRSLEKRNLIEPRKKTMRKKKWTKQVYKRSYKKGFEDVLTNPKADGFR